MQLALEIADQQKLFLELKQSAIELAIKAADKVIGEMTSANEEKIINFITKYINILEQELTVKIMLHPKTIALVGEKVEALIANNPLKFSMQADEHVKETDCLIKWHDGEVEYNTKSLWQRIQAAIAN
jgi:flagellar biosynthesis/type III secretory pathway protein FliH